MYFENIVALWIAIEKECPQEVAFKYLDRYLEDNPKKIKGNLRFKWTNEDIQDIKKFREQGLTYKEISEIYCVSYHTINSIFKNKKKMA